jgi:RimJ/RimL family protein N-acetyltransferase
MTPLELRTSRVLMRPWRPQDLEPFAALNADPEVMEHFPGTLSQTESAGLMARIESAFGDGGYGLWALELPGEEPFIGFLGLITVGEDFEFAPAVELGWRMARPWWGRGIATEAGKEVVRYAFDELGLDELVAYTAMQNERSRRVMVRLGMTHNPAEDFAHPAIPPASRVSRHVLYRLPAASWRGNKLGSCAGATPIPPAPKS